MFCTQSNKQNDVCHTHKSLLLGPQDFPFYIHPNPRDGAFAFSCFLCGIHVLLSPLPKFLHHFHPQSGINQFFNPPNA
jgi:hypothetical protein